MKLWTKVTFKLAAVVILLGSNPAFSKESPQKLGREPSSKVVQLTNEQVELGWIKVPESTTAGDKIDNLAAGRIVDKENKVICYFVANASGQQGKSMQGTPWGTAVGGGGSSLVCLKQ